MAKAHKAKAKRPSARPTASTPTSGAAPRKSILRPTRSRRPDDAYAFLPDFRDGPIHTGDTLAETLAEEFLASATSAEESGEDYRDAVVPEEYGGPFTVASAREEIAYDDDPANPIGSTREPFPTAVRIPGR